MTLHSTQCEKRNQFAGHRSMLASFFSLCALCVSVVSSSLFHFPGIRAIRFICGPSSPRFFSLCVLCVYDWTYFDCMVAAVSRQRITQH